MRLAMLGALAHLVSVGLLNRDHRGRTKRLLRDCGYAAAGPLLELPPVAPDRLLPDRLTIELSAAGRRDGNVTMFEEAVLAAFAAGVAAGGGEIFEVGTFDGRTTRTLAANAPDTQVFTLDLPPTLAPALDVLPAERHYIEKAASGEQFADTAVATRIHQLYGDSATFDFSPFRGRMGLVFVDGSHAYDYVANDAMRALAMLRPEGGVILFHDYGTVWDDVTRALNDLRRTVPAFGALRHVEGTTLAVLDAR